MADAWATVVEREPEWDDATRTRVEALDWHDNECCSGCGTHESILKDPENNKFDLVEKVCPICASLATYHRIVAERDDKISKGFGQDPPPEVARPEDGRSIHLRKLTPQEVAERPTQLQSE